MNKRDVIGKRIARIVQERDINSANRMYDHLHAIVLEDGTEIRFIVQETDNGEYGLRAFVVKPKAG